MRQQPKQSSLLGSIVGSVITLLVIVALWLLILAIHVGLLCQYGWYKLRRLMAKASHAARRIYSGNDSAKQILYQVDRPQEGIGQTFAVELFDEKKRLIMRSEEIKVTNELAEGK